MSELNDHDLLIELRTEMRGLRTDINKFSVEYRDSIKELQVTKFGSKDFADTWGRFVSDHEARIRIQESGFNQETKDCINDLSKDMEDIKQFRSKVLGGYAVAFFVGSIIVGVVVNLVVNHFSK